MVEKIYFIENNTEGFDEMLANLINCIPCFVEQEFVEMNYTKVTIKANEPDVRTVEKFFAPFV